MLVISKVLLLVEEIRPRTSQVDNFGATIAVLFQSCAFKAIKRIRNTLPTTYNTLVLIVPKRALIAYADQSSGSNVAVANGALAITFVAQTANSNAGLLTAHHKIRMMARHGEDKCRS